MLWLSTGQVTDSESRVTSELDPAAAAAAVQAMRLARKPRTVRVNMKSVVGVLQGSQPFAFTKPIPLRDLVAICNGIWREESGTLQADAAVLR